MLLPSMVPLCSARILPLVCWAEVVHKDKTVENIYSCVLHGEHFNSITAKESNKVQCGWLYSRSTDMLRLCKSYRYLDSQEPDDEDKIKSQDFISEHSMDGETKALESDKYDHF